MDHPTTALVLRFKTEIATLERIENRHIVGHIDHGEWEGRPYLVMELLKGLDLRVYATKLHQRPPKERYSRVREIGQDLCRALEHLHRLGLVHRDLKPSNVMRTEQGRVVLTDFGIVKDLEWQDRTDVGMIIGTMAFASPEQMDGDRVDTRADLFGLGATLYYLLTLQRPYEVNPRPPDQRPVPPSSHDPGIPPDLEAVVLRLMAHQPQNRYPDARAASHALGQGRAEGVPIAGRQAALRRVAQALRAAEAGGSVCLVPSGPLGAGKGWLADMVRQGARARGVVAYEVREPEASRAALTALNERESCVVVDTVGLELPEHVQLIEVPLVPLGLADVRRTVVGVAPRTREPAVVADRLHRLSGGIPGLLVPLITSHTEDDAIFLPEEIKEPALIDSFFEDLDLDELEVLGVVALAWPPPRADLIEEVTQVPSMEALKMMKARGLVQENQGEWLLGASLFRVRILDALADREGLESRISAHRHHQGLDFGGLSGDISAQLRLGRDRMMEGALRRGMEDLGRARDLAHGLGDRELEARVLCRQGLACMDTGSLELAGSYLADGTALARAVGDDGHRRLCHVLRAQVSLDLSPEGTTGALAALDRLMSLESGASSRKGDVADALMYAVWSRVSARLDDTHGAALRESRSQEAMALISAEWQTRCHLNLARHHRVMGRTQAALDALEKGRRTAAELPLLLWWIEAAVSALKESSLKLPGAICRGLSAAEVDRLEKLAGS
jgi:hypothetical protein